MGNVYPAEMQAIAGHMQSGNAAAASAAFEAIRPGVDAILGMPGGVLPPIKFVLRQRGVPAGYCSLPFADPTEEQKAVLAACFNLGQTGI